MMSGVMGMHFVLVCGSHVWHLRQILGTANSGWYQIKDPNRWVQGFFIFIFFFTMVNSGLKNRIYKLQNPNSKLFNFSFISIVLFYMIYISVRQCRYRMIDVCYTLCLI